MGDVISIERARKFYKKCPRCHEDLHFLTNSAGDFIIMCKKKKCEFAVMQEGSITFLCSG